MQGDERALADEHVGELRKKAEQYHLGVVARCCSGAGGFFRSLKDRVRGDHQR